MLENVVDLSRQNTATSFQRAKQNGNAGVFHKAAQGKTVVDAKYHARRERVFNAGLLWGAYHFGIKENFVRQAEHFFDTADPTATDSPVLDFEPTPIGDSGTMTLAEAGQFVTPVNQKTGRFPGLYSGQSFIRQKVGSNTNTTLKGDVQRLTLGIPVYYYEFSDLFRDDKNPSGMDLQKFQMFGWTIVAIFIYSWLFLSNLNDHIGSLPLVPESIVILTGLSQAGYLAGKGVSNIEPNKNQGT